ncbi:MAG: FliI/YscN family ATPase [Chthoniobacter sp.]|nr:FliI/YscN family ATPase [Chthoniobacter sp.]
MSVPPANPEAAKLLARFRERLLAERPVQRVGHVVRIAGLIIESEGPNLALGEVCEIRARSGDAPIYAEVVGFRDQRLLLMPLGETHNLRAGSEVFASAFAATAPVGAGLLGRTIDGLGRPMDGLGPLICDRRPSLHRAPPNPLGRQRICEPLATGVRAIDAFTPVGCGQRIGIFAGSGVGKSTLLGMMARGAESDVNVIALIGERGRELREFIEKDLGEEGLRRSVVVCSTSDQSALVRLRAAMLATTIAENFRDAGKKVLFMMDSVTRFAMAQREIGLAVGETPSSRGYTPSVFALLPRLLERTGAAERGSITAFYTVLVDGDDMNEPIADAVRGILDGHIVLTRALATANHFPAIDVLESVSRLVRDITTEPEQETAGNGRDLLALYRKNEDLVSIGAYVKGTNPRLDLAIAKTPALNGFLRQPVTERVPRAAALQQLHAILQ